MEKARVGFIGCGGIAQFHFTHFEAMKDKAEIVAACDLKPERTKATAERFGCREYQDYNEMFEKEQLDAVYICVQPGAHNGMEFVAIDKGVNMFVQKPMTLAMKYAKKVLAGIKKKKLISAVGLQCRYPDTLPTAKKWVDSKVIGMIEGNRLGGFPMVWWWRIKEESGGQHIEQTIHNYDLCRYLFGEVVRVQAAYRSGVITDIENNDVEDASSTILTFADGKIGTFNTGCFGPGPGDIKAHAPDNCHLTYGLGGDYTISEPNMTISGKPSNDYGLDCDETFIDAVRGAIPASEILSPYSDAIKTLALVFAIDESMHNDGIPVKPEI